MLESFGGSLNLIIWLIWKTETITIFCVLILSCRLSQFHSRQVTWWIQTEISILIHLSLYYEEDDGDPNSRTNLKGV